MRVKAPAKINLSLKILKKRPDNYHELEMTLVPISIFDEIDIEIKKKTIITDKLELEVISRPFGPQNEENLVYKTVHYFFKKIPKPIQKQMLENKYSITIQKEIPSEAGFGGGSSDAANVLKALNKLHGDPISSYDYTEIAFSLGADIPFFLNGQAAFIQGIGNKITPTPLKETLYLVVFFPGIKLSTREIFSNFDKHYKDLELTSPKADDNSLKDIHKLFGSIRDTYMLKNDLEKVAGILDNRIQDCVRTLINNGASTAIMSGSGSGIFGIYPNKLKRDDVYPSLQKELVDKFPHSKIFSAHTI